MIFIYDLKKTIHQLHSDTLYFYYLGQELQVIMMQDLCPSQEYGCFEYTLNDEVLRLSDQAKDIIGEKKASTVDVSCFSSHFGAKEKALLRECLSPQSTLHSQILLDCKVTNPTATQAISNFIFLRYSQQIQN